MMIDITFHETILSILEARDQFELDNDMCRRLFREARIELKRRHDHLVKNLCGENNE